MIEPSTISAQLDERSEHKGWESTIFLKFGIVYSWTLMRIEWINLLSTYFLKSQ